MFQIEKSSSSVFAVTLPQSIDVTAATQTTALNARKRDCVDNQNIWNRD